jgi:hypothetical protein
MSLKLLCVTMASATLVLSGCTSRSPQSVQIDKPKHDEVVSSPQPAVQPTSSPVANIDTTAIVSGETADLPIVINESELQQAFANLDIKSMKYRFSYIATQEGDLTFTNGKASLTFKDLPTGKSALLKLELLEGSTVKFEASQANFTVNKGISNRISLKLQAVGASGGGTTPAKDAADLQIDVTVPGSGGGTANPAPATPTTTADPIAEWDGKSFKGNSKWDILPVGG